MRSLVFAALALSSTVAFAGTPDTAFVVGGSGVKQGAWPDLVGLVYEGEDVFCTGTLVAPAVVLTAAHCIDDRVKSVVIGTTDWMSTEGERIMVAEKFVHPDADLAVLTLQREAIAAPRTIAAGCVNDRYLSDGAPVATVGFGATDSAGSVYDSIAYEGYTEIVDADCDDPSQGCRVFLPVGSELVAGGNGVDACNGDSGGPLYLLTEVGDFLVGVTSRAALGGDDRCGDGGIWVRPDAFVPWIQQVTGQALPEPTCTMFPVADDAEMEVFHGQPGDIALVVDDEDSDRFYFDILEGPEHGTATISDEGVLSYESDLGFTGTDRVLVQVRDASGIPAGSDTAVIKIEVLRENFLHDTLGCSSVSGGAAMSLWWLGLGGLLLRRRQNLSA